MRLGRINEHSIFCNKQTIRNKRTPRFFPNINLQNGKARITKTPNEELAILAAAEHVGISVAEAALHGVIFVLVSLVLLKEREIKGFS